MCRIYSCAWTVSGFLIALLWLLPDSDALQRCGRGVVEHGSICGQGREHSRGSAVNGAHGQQRDIRAPNHHEGVTVGGPVQASKYTTTRA